MSLASLCSDLGAEPVRRRRRRKLAGMDFHNRTTEIPSSRSSGELSRTDLRSAKPTNLEVSFLVFSKSSIFWTEASSCFSSRARIWTSGRCWSSCSDSIRKSDVSSMMVYSRNQKEDHDLTASGLEANEYATWQLPRYIRGGLQSTVPCKCLRAWRGGRQVCGAPSGVVRALSITGRGVHERLPTICDDKGTKVGRRSCR